MNGNSCILINMPQMVLLRQCVLSGLLDRVARRVPGSEGSRRQIGKYVSCCSHGK